MKSILLTQNKITLVDDEDYERLTQHKWYAERNKRLWYVVRMANILNPTDKRKKIYMHRVIMKAKSGEQIDHADLDGLNNPR